MVTGSSHIKFNLLKTDASLQSSNVKSSHSVIVLSANGFSALILNAEKNKTLLLAEVSWPDNLSLDGILSNYEDCIHELPVRIDHCMSTVAIMDFDKFSLVPETLYTKGSGKTILSYTSPLAKGEQIYTDHLKNSEAIAVYALPKNLLNWYNKQFSTGSFRHQCTALNELYKLYNQLDTFAHLHVKHNSADFFVARKGKVLFYNKFPFNVEEDLLYYLLFALEQNRVLATEISLYLSGASLKGEKLFKLLERYIGEVEELPLVPGLELSPNHAAREVRQNINLLGGL